MAWLTPKTDWVTNPTNPVPADFNRIEGNIAQLNTDVSTGKTNLFNAIVSKGITPISTAFADLVTAISNIIKATGNAADGDVLLNKTYSNATGNNRTGTMPNNGAVTITPSTAEQTIPAGYHNGNGKVSAITQGAGDYVLSKSDTQASSSATSYTKVKEIKVLGACTLRIKFDFLGPQYSSTGYVRIYKNGVAYGTEHAYSNSQEWITYSEDLSFAADDLIQIYVKSSGYNSTVMNFRLCINLPITSTVVNI